MATITGTIINMKLGKKTSTALWFNEKRIRIKEASEKRTKAIPVFLKKYTILFILIIFLFNNQKNY